MRWADEMKGRASLMRRMLKTIGAMERIPEDKCVGHDIRVAASRCICCKQADSCEQWLQEHADDDVIRAPDLCPNAELFNSWLEAQPESETQN